MYSVVLHPVTWAVQFKNPMSYKTNKMSMKYLIIIRKLCYRKDDRAMRVI